MAPPTFLDLRVHTKFVAAISQVAYAFDLQYSDQSEGDDQSTVIQLHHAGTFRALCDALLTNHEDCGCHSGSNPDGVLKGCFQALVIRVRRIASGSVQLRNAARQAYPDAGLEDPLELSDKHQGFLDDKDTTITSAAVHALQWTGEPIPDLNTIIRHIRDDLPPPSSSRHARTTDQKTAITSDQAEEAGSPRGNHDDSHRQRDDGMTKQEKDSTINQKSGETTITGAKECLSGDSTATVASRKERCRLRKMPNNAQQAEIPPAHLALIPSDARVELREWLATKPSLDGSATDSEPLSSDSLQTLVSLDPYDSAQWITDDVIAAMGKLIATWAGKQGTPTVFVPTNRSFYTEEVAKGGVAKVGDTFGVESDDFQQAQIVFLPVFVHTNHFVLLVVRPQEHVIEVWDSHRGSDCGDAFMSRIREWAFLADKCQKEFRVVLPPHATRQLDSNSCGPVVCYHMARLVAGIRDVRHTVSADDGAALRWWMLWCLQDGVIDEDKIAQLWSLS